MRRRFFLSAILVHSGAIAVLSSTTGCGSILYPERRGQPHNHQIDWKIVALDGLGLILFFIPGVIAFAVDFYTGAIYLPPGPTYLGRATEAESLQRIELVEQDKNVVGIERVVSQHVGRPVNLDETARVSELAKMDQFDQRVVEHEQDKSFGESLANFFMFRNRFRREGIATSNDRFDT